MPPDRNHRAAGGLPVGVEVNVLRSDPALARAVPEPARAAASDALVTTVCSVPEGAWNVTLREHPSLLGLLVLDGLLLREVSVAGGRSGELLGPGDVLRPWDDPTAEGPLPVVPEWTALAPVRVALLDRGFVASAAVWPELVVELGSRLLHRSRCQSALLAISHVPRLEPRLVATLWHLADRFGHVEDEGVAMPLRLTHGTLSVLSGGRRPSVSRSMARLAAAGWVLPRPAGGWWLRGDAGTALDAAGNHGYTSSVAVGAAGSAAAG